MPQEHNCAHRSVVAFLGVCVFGGGRVLRSSLSSCRSIQQTIQRLRERQNLDPPAPSPLPRPSDPVEDVNAFIAEFEASYGPEHPAFMRGSYSQALAAAKQQLKPLVVYLHCADHQVSSSPALARSVAAYLCTIFIYCLLMWTPNLCPTLTTTRCKRLFTDVAIRYAKRHVGAQRWLRVM